MVSVKPETDADAKATEADILTDIDVLLTGFGPFGKHKVNASWEAVGELDRMILAVNPVKPSGRCQKALLHVRKMPVEWDTVEQLVPTLHAEVLSYDKEGSQKGSMCIHVGVGHPGAIRIETCAFNGEHTREDAAERVPCPTKNGKCITGGVDELHTSVDVDAIVDELAAYDLKIERSNDAGRYLCNFSFYLSQALTSNTIPVLFIHVPPIGDPYTKEELTRGIRTILECVIRQRFC